MSNREQPFGQEFDFLAGQRIDMANKYGILPSEANLAKIQKKDDAWFFGDDPIEQYPELEKAREELYEKDKEYWKN